jgi:hypothetical protein
MKRAKILTMLLCVAVAFGAPLFAQDGLESDMERIAEDARKEASDSAQSEAPESTAEPVEEQQVQAIMPMSEKPKRFFEIGVDVNTGVANNALAFNELFREEIVLNIPAIRDKVGENGMNLALSPSSANVFLNINIGEFLGVGFFSKMEGDLTLTLGSALLDFLADGNVKDEDHNMGGEAVSVAGGIYMEAGMNGFLHLDRWTFTATPAAFLPLVYIPKSSLNYSLETSPNFKFGLTGGIDVYTPFSMENGTDVSNITGNMGFDLTFGAEYGFFDWLYVGGTANHIPIVPSTLHNLMSIKGDGLGIGITDPLSNPKIETNTDVTQTYSDDEKKTVFRPLTFDVYAKWKLLDMSLLKFALKPNLGFTVLTASDVPTFNWGVQADLSLLFLSFRLGTGLNQGVWKHRAGFGINLRILEILAEASIESTDFLSSFDASGLGVGVGFRFGF